ncbi:MULTISPECIES: phage holin family protein [unclassified Pseudomonas]|uniref:phage holin family protein n=1 Tax=unclassified Pseudomonas TaxID=196821 RepID=UPI0007027CF7|nr:MULTISPECIES: phage holin family protein [unclassified Pseudomonas]KQZ80631.1 pyocin R2, holin [Pseudomonas sp. Root562]
MTTEHYALLDMPLWLFITLPLVGGIVGEMWRADKEGVTGRPLLRRLIMRSGSSVVCGASAIMLLHAANVSIWAVCAGGCLTAMAGTDVVLGLYERWVAKRLGVRDVLPDEAED